jgi:hypothetical protein
VVAACGRIDFDPRSAGLAPLTVDTSVLAGTATDFPLPVFVGSHYGVDAASVQIYDAAGVPLPTEADDDLVWVRVTLPAGGPVTLQIGLGRLPAQPGPVWADSYEGVWHLAGTGAAVRDASNHHRDGVASGTTSASGVLGNARAFAGAPTDYITAQTGTPIGSATLTVSGWLWLNALPVAPSWASVLTREHLNSSDDDVYLGVDGITQRPTAQVWTDTNYDSVSQVTQVTGRWEHLAGVFDGTAVVVYVDGVQPASATPSTGTSVDETTALLYLGCDRNNLTSTTPANTPDDDFTDSILDEVRLESVARTPDWLELEDHAMRDQVVTYGALP